jgi:CheY-like chemotaxis protein
MRILLIDDMKKHRKAGIEQLTTSGHEVVALSSYEDAARLVEKEKSFDVALIDLLMPAEAMMLGGEGLQFLGQPQDVGFSLPMKLALEGVKKIAVLTDMNHHSHPASAIFDWFLGKEINISGSEVHFMHAQLTKEGTKNWLAALEALIGGENK